MNRNTKESRMVMMAPTQIGIPNKILRAVAEPMTSWMSDPMIAISVIIHRM